MEKKKKFIHRLRNKYRLVIMNEGTFEEKASLTLSKLNVFVVLSSLLVFFLGFLVTIFISTPLKEYIPGCIDKDQARLLMDLRSKMDSLERIAIYNEALLMNKTDILLGRVDTSGIDTVVDRDSVTMNIPLDASGREKDLRSEMEPQNDYSIKQRGADNGRENLFAPFFSPLRGVISSGFDPAVKHLATDVVSSTDQTVKATMHGTVVLASWTPETGNVIVLQHDNNLLSIYKHNAVLLKKVGNFVDAGEAIAVVGNSGELSSGPHLHFEIWHNGVAINPEDYVVFK